jgi:hypothetical protein
VEEVVDAHQGQDAVAEDREDREAKILQDMVSPSRTWAGGYYGVVGAFR